MALSINLDPHRLSRPAVGRYYRRFPSYDEAAGRKGCPIRTGGIARRIYLTRVPRGERKGEEVEPRLWPRRPGGERELGRLATAGGLDEEHGLDGGQVLEQGGEAQRQPGARVLAP